MVLKLKQLKNGSYLMLWNVNLGPPFASTKTFKCEDRLPTFKLHYKYYAEDEEEERYSDYNIDYDSSSIPSLNPESTLVVWLEVVDKELLSAHHPVTATAFLREEIREMTRSENNEWSTVKWTYDGKGEPVNDESCLSDEYTEYEEFTLGLSLEFQSRTDNYLANLYANVFENQTMGDVKFIVQGQEMAAHSDILANANLVMAAMLHPGNFIEGQTKTVNVPYVEPAVFDQLLRHIYTGSAPRVCEESITEPLFMAADMYQLDQLKEDCEEGFIQQLKVANVFKYLALAQFHSLPRLEEAVIKFLVKHRRDLCDLPDWKELASAQQTLFSKISYLMRMESLSEKF